MLSEMHVTCWKCKQVLLDVYLAGGGESACVNIRFRCEGNGTHTILQPDKDETAFVVLWTEPVVVEKTP